jgi:hypothetical protein
MRVVKSMATKKQIDANRKNALKSTGPQTELGKKISCRNSTRHGFYATSVLLPDDDPNEFMGLARRLASAYAPRGILEEEQVRTIIESRWQLRRANLVDTVLFLMYRFYDGEERGVGTAFAQDAAQANALSKLARYQGALIRKLQNEEKELTRLKLIQPMSQPGQEPEGARQNSNVSAAQMHLEPAGQNSR